MILAFMSFALVPDGGPPRLVRFVDGFGDDDILSVLKKHTNELVVARPLYDKLTEHQKQKLLRTHEPVLRYGIESERVLSQLEFWEDWPAAAE